MESALVTGGCGFLGSSIVKELLGRGVRVRVLALPGEPTDNLGGLPVEIVYGDVLDPESASRAVANMSTVFHAAAVYKNWAPDPTRLYEVNLRGTYNMLEAARRAGVQRVVYTSSIVALGRPEPPGLGDENTPYEAWDLDFPYSRSKYYSRLTAEDFARWGLDVRIVCPAVVLGPGDITPTPSGSIIINAVKTGRGMYMDGGIAYVDVRDAAAVHVLAAERGRPGQRYIAAGHNLTNKELVAAVFRVANIRAKFVKMPTALVLGLARAMEKRALKTGGEPELTSVAISYAKKPAFYSNRKAVEELGARFRPLDVTIRDAIEYFESRGMLARASR